MIELSPWVPAILIQISILLGLGLGYSVLRGKRTHRRLRAALAAAKADPSPAATTAPSLPGAVAGPASVLLTEDDLLELRPLTGFASDPSALRALQRHLMLCLGELEKVDKRQAALTTLLDDVVREHEELVAQVAMLPGIPPEELLPAVQTALELVQSVETHARHAFELAPRVREAIEAARAPIARYGAPELDWSLAPISHQMINQRILDRADHQTVEEHDELRAEVATFLAAQAALADDEPEEEVVAEPLPSPQFDIGAMHRSAATQLEEAPASTLPAERLEPADPAPAAALEDAAEEYGRMLAGIGT